jgi:hypothetical protein
MKPIPAAGARRRWGFRCAAVLLGLSAVLFVEGVCRLGDWGRPEEFEDPFVGFSGARPLFVLNDSGDRYVIPPSRLRFFRTESFPAKKKPGTFRIFVLGGSTIAGEPYEKETSLTSWLQLALGAADSNRNWEVVNCGGISYASYRLAPILKECLQYEPDLFIVATGHNEFLEDRTYEHIKRATPAVVALGRAASRLRIFTLLRALTMKLRQAEADPARDKRHLLNDEVTARLDFQGGLDLYHRDAAWRDTVVVHFENNVRRMAAMCRSAGVPILLVHVCSNLRDSPPFKSEHRVGFDEEDAKQFDSLVAEARGRYRTDLRGAAELLEQAVALDDEHALTWFELGKCYDGLHDFEQARRAFLNARDQDICPLRMITPLEDALLRVVRENDAPFVDMHALLEARSRTRILGNDWLVDHIHPSIEGHQLVADSLAEEMSRLGWVALDGKWSERKQAAYRRHFDALPPEYFTRGQQTLEALRGWAAGRAEKLPEETE